MSTKRAARGLLLSLMLVTSAFAHHGTSGYDYSVPPLTLTGVITSVELVNPHPWVYIDVKVANGQTEEWALEGGSANSMVQSGLKDALKPGVTVTAVGAPLKAQTSTPASDKVAFKKRHLLQVGNIKLADGVARSFGMGPKP